MFNSSKVIILYSDMLFNGENKNGALEYLGNINDNFHITIIKDYLNNNNLSLDSLDYNLNDFDNQINIAYEFYLNNHIIFFNTTNPLNRQRPSCYFFLPQYLTKEQYNTLKELKKYLKDYNIICLAELYKTEEGTINQKEFVGYGYDVFDRMINWVKISQPKVLIKK